MLLQYFHSFYSKTDMTEFEDEQRRFYSKPREETDCPTLPFGLQQLSSTEKTHILTSINSIIHVDNFFGKIRGELLSVCLPFATWELFHYLWSSELLYSKDAKKIRQGLQATLSLLEINRACSTLAEKFHRANEIYYIFNVITEGSKVSAPCLGSADSCRPNEPLGEIIDRLVELIDLEATSHVELAEIQITALRCLHLYLTGPRIPMHKAHAV